jgi:hypothetical protein
MKIKFNRIIAFIFVIFIAQHSFAQTPLTNRQIYDFNPGDVVQGTHFYKLDPGPPSYETFTYLKRTSSKNNDTLFYKIRREYYTPPACQDCKPLVWIDTITQAYMELDSIAKHYNETFQYSIKDTFYNDFCNRRVWAKKPDKLDSVWFEPTKHYTYYVEGLGGPFYKKEFSQGGPTTLDFVLTYYKKDGISCGNFVNDVQDFKAHNLKATIFPNPLNEKATIHFEKPMRNISIVIYNLEGQKVNLISNFQGSTIDISRGNLKSGIYFLQVNDINGSWSQKIIVK